MPKDLFVWNILYTYCPLSDQERYRVAMLRAMGDFSSGLPCYPRNDKFGAEMNPGGYRKVKCACMSIVGEPSGYEFYGWRLESED